MARWNLLEITQKVLNAAEEDVVNSVEGTDGNDASDAAIEIIEEVYFDLIHSEDWPFLCEISKLTGLSDVTQPTVLQIPDDVTLLDHQEFFQYDVTEVGGTNSKYRDLIYKEPGDFMRMLRNRNDSNANITKYTGYQSVDMLIQTDKMPEYWTSFDDEYIVLDSFHSATESTIQGTKTSIQLKRIPTWSNLDNFIPDLPDNMFPNFLARCKAKFFTYFTHKENPIDILEAHSGKARQRRKGTKTDGRNKRKDYGRKRRSASYIINNS